MTTTRHDLVEVIAKKTLGIKDYNTLVREVAAFLLEENLVNDLDSIMRDVIQFRLASGIIEAVVVSAHPLSDADLKDVKDLLRQEYPDAKSYIVDQRLDPSVIGGVKINLPGAQLDLSIFEKLSLFKRQTAIGKEAI